ncbi:MAG: TetR/AcrR family transcriptional regulator [Chloroflexi bacterium]|nr:TetR/AcrR family transcriptional regulator [Chloroflexota bacterium]
MPLGDEKRLERRRRLLAAARELLGRVGYGNVTMKGLADEAGVTAPTLYNTFGSKDDLLFEAVLEHYEQLLEEAGPATGVRGLDRVISILTSTAETMSREPQYVQTLMDSFRSRPGARALGRALRLEGLQALVEAMEEMRSDGDLQEWVDPNVMATIISGLRRGVTIDWVSGRVAFDDLADMTICSACVMLAGVTTGDAAERCRRIAEERQGRLSVREAGTRAEQGRQLGSLV